MDIRTAIAGALGLIAIIAAAYLYATGADIGAERMAGLAAVSLTYLLGLHSSPYDDSEG